MTLRVTAGVVALVIGFAVSAAGQSEDQVLTQYLAAQAALAAGNRDAASAALSALAAASADTTVVSRAQAAARATDVAAMRRAFRDLSQGATRWTRPDGVVVFFCAESDGGRGAFWLQRAGNPANPYDQGSSCGSEISVEQVSFETGVVGYLDTYGRPDSYSATRLDAPLLDVPLAVTPITRDLMNDQNTLDVNDAVGNTSTTTPITGFNQRPNFYLIRGFYVFNYRDGIRTLLDGPAPINAFGLEGVEVLRGPSSILYGKGEPGGLVNFTSKRPIPVLGGLAGINFGSNGLMRGDFDLTGPLGKAAAGRVIVSGYGADSYRDSVETDGLYVNPSVSVRIGSRTTVWASGEYTRYHFIPDTGVLVSQGGSVPPYFTRERFAGDPRVANGKMDGFRFAAEADIKVNPAWDLRIVGGTENADQEQQLSFQNLIDGGPAGYQGLIAPNSLLRITFDELPNRRYDYGRLENVWRFAHGSGGSRMTHQLLASVDYRRDRENTDTDIADYDILSYVDGSTSNLILGVIPVGQGGIYRFSQQGETTQSDTGVAAQDLIAIGTRLNILAGLRFESNRIESVRTGVEQIFGAIGGPAVSLDAAPPPAESSSVAPRLGVVYKATPRLSFYGSYLTAFQSPVPGLLTQDGQTLTPEHSRQLEGGVKTALSQDRLFLTTAVYKSVKDDAFVFYPGYAENAGREESKGFEIELVGSMSPEWSVMAGYTFTDMEFTESSPNLLGKTRPGVPKHSFSSWVQYAPNRASMRGVLIGAGVSSIGEVWASYPNTATLEGYASLDAMAGYERQSWRVQVNAMNLTDALGYSPSGGFFAGGDPNVNPMSALPIPGRRVIANLTFRFR